MFHALHSSEGQGRCAVSVPEVSPGTGEELRVGGVTAVRLDFYAAVDIAHSHKPPHSPGLIVGQLEVDNIDPESA